MTTERAYTVQDARDIFARWENGHATEADLAGGLNALIDALSTPPADDVREALIDAMIDVEVSGGMVEFGKDDRSEAAYLADAILAAFEVHPRGPVGEAEVNTAPPALLNDFYTSGLRRAIEIIQNEDYPLSYGLARVDAMVSDIEDEIKIANEARP